MAAFFVLIARLLGMAGRQASGKFPKLREGGKMKRHRMGFDACVMGYDYQPGNRVLAV
jgi:hypothetical protein